MFTTSTGHPNSRNNNILRRLRVVVVIVVLLMYGSLTITIKTNALSTKQVQYNGGAGVGKFVIDERASKSDIIQCHYDMVLVERIQGRPKTDSGLFVPQQDLPRLHLCRVIAYGPGKEEENGRIVPVQGIQINDIIIAKNPWGIGPRDEETTDGKKLSYMRFQDVAAIISGGIPPEEEDE
jgi:co-chaperonin GroES (HSP10)